MLPLQPFVVPLGGLKAGDNPFEWKVDGEFFATFEGTEILDADLLVKAVVTDDGEIGVSCEIDGTVTVICDRCLENLVLPVSTSFEEDDYEISGGVLDFRQDVYDYVCLTLPIQRFHPEGECNSETVKYLSK